MTIAVFLLQILEPLFILSGKLCFAYLTFTLFTYRLRESGVAIRFCTNTSCYTKGGLSKKLREMGFKDIKPEELYTPAPAVRLVLEQRGLRPFIIADPGMTYSTLLYIKLSLSYFAVVRWNCYTCRVKLNVNLKWKGQVWKSRCRNLLLHLDLNIENRLRSSGWIRLVLLRESNRWRQLFLPITSVRHT